MSKKPVMMRVSEDAHQYVKEQSVKHGLTMPDMFDHIVKTFKQSKRTKANAK